MTEAKKLQKTAEEIIPESESLKISEEPVRTENTTSAKVLLIEDNEEVRDYLRKNLQDKYKILEAPDGKIGFQQAEKEQPDLIISDVMMPEMDGFELCDKIKSEVTTNHIPVILLTARADKEDKLEGLKTGADDYLPKPFDLEELYVRMENLIQQRERLKERFLKEALFGIDKILFHPAEQEFIEKITPIINHNIDNVEYTVNNFARDIGMSRAQLFRKVKAWTNQTPQDFIRLCRLKKAAILLKDETQNVTEVAFAVGFKNASHFIRSFKNQFGRTPKEFVKS
jgi:DNA-binding response OmpR family regulator